MYYVFDGDWKGIDARKASIKDGVDGWGVWSDLILIDPTGTSSDNKKEVARTHTHIQQTHVAEI